MEAHREPDGGVCLRLSQAEVVVLHEVIAFSEWSNELDAIELRLPVEQKIISAVQQSLAPLIPELGTENYGKAVSSARSSIDLNTP